MCLRFGATFEKRFHHQYVFAYEIAYLGPATAEVQRVLPAMQE